MGQEPSVNEKYRKIENLYYRKKRLKKTYVSVIFRWVEDASDVSIIGSWNSWKDDIIIPFNKEENCFTIILTLPVGKHYFRFLVDGEYRIDKSLKKIKDKDGGYSNEIIINETTSVINQSRPAKPLLNNLQRQELKERFERLPNKPPKIQFNDREYSSKRQRFFESKKTPPEQPPHLKYTPLASRSITTEFFENSILPIPIHVTLNHIYFAESIGNIKIIGLTLSHGMYDDKKFTTIQYYTPCGEMRKKKKKIDNLHLSESVEISSKLKDDMDDEIDDGLDLDDSDTESESDSSESAPIDIRKELKAEIEKEIKDKPELVDDLDELN